MIKFKSKIIPAAVWAYQWSQQRSPAPDSAAVLSSWSPRSWRSARVSSDLGCLAPTCVCYPGRKYSELLVPTCNDILTSMSDANANKPSAILNIPVIVILIIYSSHHFFLLVNETLGPINAEVQRFSLEMGHLITAVTSDPRVGDLIPIPAPLSRYTAL